jgi:carboxylesterase
MRVRPFTLGLLGLVAIGLCALALCLVPLRPADLGSHARPARSYAEAMAQLAALEAQDDARVNPLCRTRVYTHGASTERVVVCLHGLTNCPAQFDSLAQLAYASGCNVIVPRLPQHGFADRMTPAMAQLDPVELCAATDRVFDAAHGLGAHVTVIGLSLGGTLAAWAAQERTDVDRVVLVAPLLGVPQARGASVFGLTRLMSVLPNAFVWWNSARRERLPGPPQVYPRFATRGLAATLLVAARVRSDAARRAPGASSAMLITLADDPAIDNAVARSLVADWQQHGLVELGAHEFPQGLGLNHDVVDPRQVGANPGLTYPVLLEALEP